MQEAEISDGRHKLLNVGYDVGISIKRNRIPLLGIDVWVDNCTGMTTTLNYITDFIGYIVVVTHLF